MTSTATTRTFMILDSSTGEVVGQAPGTDERTALEAFRRDATGGGDIYVDHTGRLCLGWDTNEVHAEDTTAGADLENGPHASDLPTEVAEHVYTHDYGSAGEERLAQLQTEQAGLQEILMTRTTNATRDLLVKRLGELKEEIAEAARWAAADPEKPNYQLIDEEIVTVYGLPLGVQEAGDEEIASGLWYRAHQALEAEVDGSMISQDDVAARVAAAYGTIYGMTGETIPQAAQIGARVDSAQLAAATDLLSDTATALAAIITDPRLRAGLDAQALLQARTALGLESDEVAL